MRRSRAERDSLHPAARRGNAGGAEHYQVGNAFWVPADARWSHLRASAKQPTIGKTVDDAMVAIERDNPRLKGVLPKDYARPGLDTARRGSALSTREATPQVVSAAKDNHRLGELIEETMPCLVLKLPVKGRILRPYQVGDYVRRRKAEAFFYFNAAFIPLLATGLAFYVLAAPQRLFIAAPPILAGMVLGAVNLLLLSKGRFTVAAATTAILTAAILAAGQTCKLLGDYHTA